MGLFDREHELDSEVLTAEDIDKPKLLILYNDDVNTFQHVMLCLMKFMEFTYDKAEQTAITIHNKGSAFLKAGTTKELKPYKEILCEYGLDARIEDEE